MAALATPVCRETRKICKIGETTSAGWFLILLLRISDLFRFVLLKSRAKWLEIHEPQNMRNTLKESVLCFWRISRISRSFLSFPWCWLGQIRISDFEVDRRLFGCGCAAGCGPSPASKPLGSCRFLCYKDFENEQLLS
jgi:hypothetical protein